MKLFVRISNAWRNFFRRRRLSLQNSTDNKVEWYTHISPASILMAFVAFVVLMFIVVLTLVGYSSILEVLPGYRTNVNRSKDFMIENILKIDSMERIINDMMLYNDNIALIMEGKTPVVRNPRIMDSTTLSKAMVAPNTMDSALRRQIESNPAPEKQSESKPKVLKKTEHPKLLTPITGVVINPFDENAGRLGVSLEIEDNKSRVEAIAGGVVMMSLWTTEGGYIVQILHPHNMISVYKNLGSTPVKKGDMVKSGEVIGYSDASLDFEFEIWEDGKAINPENYISF